MSLRDVERAMNVMVWFYNHRDALNPLMDGATDEDSDDDDDDSDANDEEDEIFQVILIKWNSNRNIVVLFISNPGFWSKEPASSALPILTSSDFSNKLNQAFCNEKKLWSLPHNREWCFMFSLIWLEQSLSLYHDVTSPSV